MKYTLIANFTSPVVVCTTEAASLTEAKANFVDLVDWKSYAEANYEQPEIVKTLLNLDSTFEELAQAAFISWEIKEEKGII